MANDIGDLYRLHFVAELQALCGLIMLTFDLIMASQYFLTPAGEIFSAILAWFTSIRDGLVKSPQSNYIGCCTLTGNDVTLHTVAVQLIMISLTAFLAVGLRGNTL